MGCGFWIRKCFIKKRTIINREQTNATIETRNLRRHHLHSGQGSVADRRLGIRMQLKLRPASGTARIPSETQHCNNQSKSRQKSLLFPNVQRLSNFQNLCSYQTLKETTNNPASICKRLTGITHLFRGKGRKTSSRLVKNLRIFA